MAFAFDEIDKYYHVITLDKEENHHYLYECIDKYIDLLFSVEDYEKSADIAQKSAFSTFSYFWFFTRGISSN